MLILLLTKPHLLVDHAQAYGALFFEACTQAHHEWWRRMLLQVAALVCLAATVVLAGTATLLWAVTPESQIHTFWVLYAVPLVPLIVALVCLVLSRQHSPCERFGQLVQQLRCDLALVRQAQSR
ncbi:MAG: hypothetical protein PHH58_11780 [Rhodoferax sp.]|nr:hypothetical protein [Rhodoferax sp.]